MPDAKAEAYAKMVEEIGDAIWTCTHLCCYTADDEVRNSRLRRMRDYFFKAATKRARIEEQSDVPPSRLEFFFWLLNEAQQRALNLSNSSSGWSVLALHLDCLYEVFEDTFYAPPNYWPVPGKTKNTAERIARNLISLSDYMTQCSGQLRTMAGNIERLLEEKNLCERQ